MRKKIWMLIYLMPVMILMACGKNEIPSSDEVKTSVSVESVEEKSSKESLIEDSSVETEKVEEKTLEKEYFTECSSMPTPDSTVPGMEFIKKDEDGTYEYRFGTDEDQSAGESTLIAWRAQLMLEDFEVSDYDVNTFLIKKDGKKVAFYLVGNVEGEYIMFLSFLD
ncbi:MAG: hypothetical protein K6G63_03435 [Eubacterium sp.]|nr:hypothetical protein [Eubacterium sp.]